MYIRDEELRSHMGKLLQRKTRNKVVTEMRDKGVKMHQYTLDRFMNKKPVSLDTLKKFDEYLSIEMQLID